MRVLWRRLILALGILFVAACATPTAQQTNPVYSDDGLSELMAPVSWRTRSNLGKSGTIRLGDDASITYLIVNSYYPGEVKARPFAEFAEWVNDSLMKRLRDAKISAPRPLTIGGRAAVEYEVAGRSAELPLVYLTTVIDGEHARHHLVFWTLDERYGANRSAMREVAASFRESATRRAAKTRTDLTFDWPERMTSTATARMKMNKRGEVVETHMRTVSTVRPLGEEQLLISARVTDRRVTTGTKDKGKADYLERVVTEAMTDVPDYVIDREGEFVRVENLAPYLKRLEDALASGLPESPKEARVKAQQLVQTLISEKTLSALMEDEWNNLVGNWAETSYVPGEIYQLEERYQSLAIGDRTFPMRVTRQLAGRQACRKGAAPDSCVRLVQTSRVSDPAFTRAMTAFVRKTLGTADVSVENVEVVKTVEVIADPDTMLPYRSVVKETKTFTVSAKAEAARTSEETKETVTTYSY